MKRRQVMLRFLIILSEWLRHKKYAGPPHKPARGIKPLKLSSSLRGHYSFLLENSIEAKPYMRAKKRSQEELPEALSAEVCEYELPKEEPPVFGAGIRLRKSNRNISGRNVSIRLSKNLREASEGPQAL